MLGFFTDYIFTNLPNIPLIIFTWALGGIFVFASVIVKNVRALVKSARALAKNARALVRNARALAKNARTLARSARALAKNARAYGKFPRTLKKRRICLGFSAVTSSLTVSPPKFSTLHGNFFAVLCESRNGLYRSGITTKHLFF
jgi:hypothetical protein